MRDAQETVLYVGKAKNLRKRLGSYRVANPERLPRRHLRLLRAVARIELQTCADESAALAREAELLLALRPRFNRAGVWLPPPKFLGFSIAASGVELIVSSENIRQLEFALPLPAEGTPAAPCQQHGPHASGARHLRNALARVLWFALHPGGGLSALPFGWLRGPSDERITVPFPVSTIPDVVSCLENLFAGQPAEFGLWALEKTSGRTALEKSVIEEDLEFLLDRFGTR